VLKQLLTQIRRLQFAADWLDLHQAERENRKLDARREAGLKATQTQREREGVESEYLDELEIIWHPIYIRRSHKLVADARKYGVPVPPVPKLYEDNDSWYFSSSAGDWFLNNEASVRLKREIKREKWQINDEWRKWVTLGISVAAFILALVSLIMKGKQPDPCSKNYYRSDSGECVFALKKISASPPLQQIVPPISVQPKKPSPTIPKP
jgi:hypothetical protein